MRRAALPVLLFLAGCHAQGGPVFSYALGQGGRIGWEAGGGWAQARGNVGQIYGPHAIEGDVAPDGSRREATTRFGYTSYAVYEPGFLVGGTLGLGLRDDFEPSFVGGGWGATPPLRSFSTGFPGRECEGTIRHDASIAAGIRYIGGALELYVTPKYLMLGCEDLL